MEHLIWNCHFGYMNLVSNMVYNTFWGEIYMDWSDRPHIFKNRVNGYIYSGIYNVYGFYSDQQQRKQQNSAILVFSHENTGDQWICLTKCSLTRQVFSWHEVFTFWSVCAASWSLLIDLKNVIIEAYICVRKVVGSDQQAAVPTDFTEFWKKNLLDVPTAKYERNRMSHSALIVV